MRRVLFLAVALFVAAPAIAAFIDYDRSLTYEGGFPIPAVKVPTIQYRGYTGPSATGPWTSGNVVTDNLAIAAPDPAPGATLWYTVDATLDGMTSFKGAAVSKVGPPEAPAGPRVRGVR